MSPTSGPGLQAQASTRSISKFKLCWVELDRKTVWKFLDFLIEKKSLIWIFFQFFFENLFSPKKNFPFFRLYSDQLSSGKLRFLSVHGATILRSSLSRVSIDWKRRRKKVKLWTQIFGLTWNQSNVWNFWRKKIVNFRSKMSFQFF